ncbi:MAG: thymidine phosphorylase [Deltaproteobacteria bacterium]|nr:thymidine phosphorylase [Deltaproteobacteria bacterium]
MATLVELIAKKRDGGSHDPGEIQRLIQALISGELADYQMSAWLMATFLRGLEPRETLELTDAMLGSGVVLDLSDVPGVKVDKHSTGGVGDKISLPLAPIVAACGVPVPMVSGRGLGHTGGTLDKLESIPGFRVDLSIADFRRIVREIGTCLIGQTKEIAPADKRIYALRDVTATVESIPLITASILSKKLAEGIDALVLDVKVGRGAFMKDLDRARALARSLVDVASRGGKGVTALLTDMDHPLGFAIGNALEAAESIDVLRGGGPRDILELTLDLAAEMLVLGKVEADVEGGRRRAQQAIDTGAAAEVLRKLIAAQHGDPRVVDDTSLLPRAKVVQTITAPRAGFVVDVDPLALGYAGVELGAGRTRADQAVDPAVGLVLRAPKGTEVRAGDPLIDVHASDEASFARVSARVASAFRIDDARVARGPLVFEALRGSGSSAP